MRNNQRCGVLSTKVTFEQKEKSRVGFITPFFKPFGCRAGDQAASLIKRSCAQSDHLVGGLSLWEDLDLGLAFNGLVAGTDALGEVNMQ